MHVLECRGTTQSDWIRHTGGWRERLGILGAETGSAELTHLKRSQPVFVYSGLKLYEMNLHWDLSPHGGGMQMWPGSGSENRQRIPVRMTWACVADQTDFTHI